MNVILTEFSKTFFCLEKPVFNKCRLQMPSFRRIIVQLIFITLQKVYLLQDQPCPTASFFVGKELTLTKGISRVQMHFCASRTQLKDLISLFHIFNWLFSHFSNLNVNICFLKLSLFKLSLYTNRFQGVFTICYDLAFHGSFR